MATTLTHRDMNNRNRSCIGVDMTKKMRFMTLTFCLDYLRICEVLYETEQCHYTLDMSQKQSY